MLTTLASAFRLSPPIRSRDYNIDNHLSDPAFAGINIENFTEEEVNKLRAIHRRVVRQRALDEHRNRERIEQENIVLRRLLLAARMQIQPGRDNEKLLEQIDKYLKYDGS